MKLQFKQLLNEAMVSDFTPQTPNAGLRLIKPMQIPPVGSVAAGKRISDTVMGGIKNAAAETRGNKLASNIMSGIRDVSGGGRQPILPGSMPQIMSQLKEPTPPTQGIASPTAATTTATTNPPNFVEIEPQKQTNFVEISPEEQARVDRENTNRKVFSLPSPSVTPGSSQNLLNKAFAGSGTNMPSPQPRSSYSGPYSERGGQVGGSQTTPTQTTTPAPGAASMPQKDRGDVQAEMEARAQYWVNQDTEKKKRQEEWRTKRNERWRTEKLAKAELFGIDKDLAGRLSQHDLSSEISRRQRMRNRQDRQSSGGSGGGGGSLRESYRFKRNSLLQEVKGFGAGSPDRKKSGVFPNIPIPDFISYDKFKNWASGLAGNISDSTPEWLKTTMKVAGDVLGVPATLAALPPRELAASTIGRLGGVGFTKQGTQDRTQHYYNLMSKVQNLNPASWVAKDDEYTHAAKEEMANLVTRALYDPRAQPVRITKQKQKPQKEEETDDTTSLPAVP